MPANLVNRPDLWFTSTGDFITDRTGDLRDTRDSTNRIEGIQQWVLHRIIGETNAWRLHRRITAGLESFKGHNITPELLRLMSDRTVEALTFDNLLSKGEIVVKALELTPGDVLIAVYLLGINEDKPIYVMSYDVQYGAVTRIR